MTAIYDLASIDALSGVATDTIEPFVQLRANSGAVANEGELDVLLLGQLDPPAARDLAMSILEAADAAEFDSMLYTVICSRLRGDPEAESKAAAILVDLRSERERR